MRKHFGMYQNGISSSLMSTTLAVVLFAIAGCAIRLPCLRVLLFSQRSFSYLMSLPSCIPIYRSRITTME